MSRGVLIRLNILGPPAIEGAGRDASESLLTRPKLVGLLTYLAMPTPGTLHQRDTVLGRFWPELDQAHAQASLRKALYRLRRALSDNGNGDNGWEPTNGANGLGGNGPILKHGDGLIGVNKDLVWCDVAAFEEASTAGEHAAAIELYRGDLLEGLFLPGLVDFERWLEIERSRLRHKAMQTAWARAEVEEEVRNWEGAAFWARRAATFAPDDETILQRLIGFLDHVGDRAGALREYDTFSRYLKQEFEAEPSAETQELIESVRRRVEANRELANARTAPPITEQPSPPPSAPAQAQTTTIPGDPTIPAKPHRSWHRPAVLVATVAAVAAVITVLSFLGRSDAANKRVLVAVFDNRTGDSTLDRLGQMAAHWITQGVAWDAVIPVVSVQTTLFVVPDVDLLTTEEHAPVVVEALAEETEAAIAVWGAFYAEDDSVRFETTIADMESRQVLRRMEPVTVARASVLDGVEQVRERTVNVLANQIERRLFRRGKLPIRPPLYDAYDEYVAALDALYVELNGRRTRQHLLSSLAADTSFDAPIIVIALLHMLAKQYDESDSVMGLLDLYRERPVYDTLMLKWIQTEANGDRIGAYIALKDLTELVPDDEFLVTKFPTRARWAGQYHEVVDILEKSYNETEPEAAAAYSLAGALGLVGQYERQLAVVRGVREERPPTLWEISQEIQPLAALGRVVELKALLDTALTQPDGIRTPGGLHAEAGTELLLHGFADNGLELLDSAIVLLQRIPVDVLERTSYGMTLAEALYTAGRYDEAAVHMEAMRLWGEELPDSLWGVAKLQTFTWAQGHLGKIAARQGQREEALDAARAIEDRSNPALRGLDMVERAGIAAIIGDRAEAVALLRGAFAAGMDPTILHSAYMFDFDNLRGYGPFEALLRPDR